MGGSRASRGVHVFEHFTVLRRKHRVPGAGGRDDGCVDRAVSQSQAAGRAGLAGIGSLIEHRIVDRSEEVADMTFVGLAVTLLGFVIAFGSLGITASTAGRLGIVLAGIVVS